MCVRKANGGSARSAPVHSTAYSGACVWLMANRAALSPFSLSAMAHIVAAKAGRRATIRHGSKCSSETVQYTLPPYCLHVHHRHRLQCLAVTGTFVQTAKNAQHSVLSPFVTRVKCLVGSMVIKMCAGRCSTTCAQVNAHGAVAKVEMGFTIESCTSN